MEPLDRTFHPRGILLIPWFMVVVGLIAASAWLATPSMAQGLPSTIVFYLGIACFLASPHLFLYRLHLQTTRDDFVVSVRFLSATVYYGETPGVSWRPIATPGSHPDEPDFCRYRVEVVREDDSRKVALGRLLCFAFGVDCL